VKLLLLLSLLSGCSYGVKEQTILANLSNKARMDCEKDKSKCKAAAACIEGSLNGVYAIQESMENRLAKKDNSREEAWSAYYYKSAINGCKLLGWQ